jgi:hypothetical protein
VVSIRAAGGTAEEFNLDITDRAACDGVAAEVSRITAASAISI